MSDMAERSEVWQKASRAQAAFRGFFPSTDQKNRLLVKLGERLVSQGDALLEANREDLDRGRRLGLSEALLDRLSLTTARLGDMAEGLKQISLLPDPIGEVVETIERPNGLKIVKQRVPLGVIGIIYEARPNVTADAAGLCLKTGNAVILRGGAAAACSNQQLVRMLHAVMEGEHFPVDYLQLIEDGDRGSVTELLTCKPYVDVIIPRGGRSLIQHVVEHAVVPVIETGEGICHLYVHEDADYAMAESIAINAKCQRPSVCNAIETLLVDRAFAQRHLAQLVAALTAQGVQVRGCEQAVRMAEGLSPATEEDWDTEYLDLILSLRIVDGMGAAIDHITQYGTQHSECIVTESHAAATRFMQEVDAAAVYHNASTRFTDGFEFGLGAEIGISTQKLHARGPMGLRELTSTKYHVYGTGQIKA